MRTWYAISVNCDCASGVTLRQNRPKGMAMRCPYCRRPLGCMQYVVIGTVRASTEAGAWGAWKAKQTPLDTSYKMS